MTTLSYTVPVAGTDLNSLADPEIATALAAIKSWANTHGVDGTNLDTSVPGRRLVGAANFSLAGGNAAATWLCTITGGNVSNSGATTTPVTWWQIDPAAWAVTGRTTQFVLKTTIGVNATAPAINFTTSLNGLTSIGGSSAALFTYTAGSAVSGSSSTFTTPAAGATTSLEVTFGGLTAGNYIPAVVTSGLGATNSLVQMTFQLFADS